MTKWLEIFLWMPLLSFNLCPYSVVSQVSTLPRVKGSLKTKHKDCVLICCYTLLTESVVVVAAHNIYEPLSFYLLFYYHYLVIYHAFQIHVSVTRKLVIPTRIQLLNVRFPIQ